MMPDFDLVVWFERFGQPWWSERELKKYVERVWNDSKTIYFQKVRAARRLKSYELTP